QLHSSNLSKQTSLERKNWKNAQLQREVENLAPLTSDVVPVFLELDPSWVNLVDFNLQSFGIEVISEEKDGFIIGASLDNLRSLEEKINDFSESKHGSCKNSRPMGYRRRETRGMET
ncbi:MAG: hypothetical protein AAFN93_25000, partial [Bacteroidota bacterium]